MSALKKAIITIIFFLTTFSVYAEILTVTLLGTGTPRPNIERFGSATLIEYKNEKFLFDVGRGATIRLSQLGIYPSNISHLFLTHLHSDHITGYADFWLTGWVWQREDHLNVYGPEGTTEFVSNIQKAYSKDIEYRHAQTGLRTSTLEVFAKDIHEGVIFNQADIKITAFKVEHGQVENALGYKFETDKYSVVISGDTTFSKNLINYSQNIDLLIHELADINHSLLEQNKRLKKISEYHTSIEQLQKTIAKSGPKQTILNHLLLLGEQGSYVQAQLQRLFKHKVVLGKDLMSITIENKKICINKECSLLE